MSKYKRSESFRVMTLREVAKDIGRSEAQTKRLMTDLNFIGVNARRKEGNVIVYSAKAVEVIKGLMRQPHRDVSSPNDWLDDYVNKGEADG